MAAKHSNTRKRKGICQDIFEIDEDELSPVHSPINEDMVNIEPLPKVLRTNDNYQTNLKESNEGLEEKSSKNEDLSTIADDNPSTNGNNTVLTSNLNHENKDTKLTGETDSKEHNTQQDADLDKLVSKNTNESTTESMCDGESKIASDTNIADLSVSHDTNIIDLPVSQDTSVVDLPVSQDTNIVDLPVSQDTDIVALPVSQDTDIVALPVSQDISDSSQCTLNNTIQNFDALLEEEGWISKDETICENVENIPKTSKPESVPTKNNVSNTDNEKLRTELLEDQILDLNNKNIKLQKEIIDLKEKLCNCVCNQINMEGKPLINVQIFDVENMQAYKKQLLRYFKSFPEFSVITTVESHTISIFSKDVTAVSSNGLENHEKNSQMTKESEVSPHKSKRKKKKKLSECNDMFVVDTTPSLFTRHHTTVRYASKFKINETDDLKSEEEEEVKRPQQSTCFNCYENHNLKDCPYPKDYRRISQARSKIRGKQSMRYHLEEEQKFSHLKPGKLSEKLREALGIGKNELPPYVYKMRELGYPPGWVLDAQDSDTSLSLFDIEGKALNRETNLKKGVIGLDKIIDYPGFNMPLPVDVKDDYRRYRCPAYSTNASKENMLKFLKDMQVKQQDNLEQIDMDISEDVTHVELTITDTVNKEPLPLDLEDNQDLDESLEDLEKKKYELLAQLDESSLLSSKNLNDDQDSSQGVLETCDTNDTENALDKTPNRSTSTKNVKTSAFGTPVLKSASKYSKLPHPDNFAQNVSAVINFENLPNSTGKYEQMTNVLQKVRKTLKGLNEKS